VSLGSVLELSPYWEGQSFPRSQLGRDFHHLFPEGVPVFEGVGKKTPHHFGHSGKPFRKLCQIGLGASMASIVFCLGLFVGKKDGRLKHN
jgi:hypothetical protein